MFAKFAVVFSALAAVVVAAPYPGSVVQCNTGPAQCCNNVFSAQSSEASAVLNNLVGANVGDLTGMIGVGCTTVAVIGGALGTNCAQQPVCCQGTQFNGLVNVGCTPISL